MRSLFAGAALAALIAGAASAGAFKVGDLGEVPSRRACKETAAKVLEAYLEDHGGLSTSGEADNPDSWTYYGWGLRPGVIDAVITCPIVGNQVNAFYTLYSSGEGAVENADIAAQQLRALWEKHH